ncbi:MAG: hypothetical protein ABIU20_08075 [Blastocatellia bacterium]
MKTETQTKKSKESEQTDGNEFARFDELARRLMSVPKKEINEKITEHEKKRKARKVQRKA